MASTAAKNEVAAVLFGLFRGEVTPELARQWDLALDSATDAQIAVGLDYARIKYTGRFVPPPGEFLSWCRSDGLVKSTGIDGARVRFERKTIRGLPHEFAYSADPAPQGPLLSGPERLRRKASIRALMDGKLDGGLTRAERDVLMAAQPEDQNKPGIIALRNKQRDALGWPLLES